MFHGTRSVLIFDRNMIILSPPALQGSAINITSLPPGIMAIVLCDWYNKQKLPIEDDPPASTIFSKKTKIVINRLYLHHRIDVTETVYGDWFGH